MNRAERIVNIRWELGRYIPEPLRANLSAAETDYFKRYSDLLMKYQSTFELDVCTVRHSWSLLLLVVLLLLLVCLS